MRGGGHSLPGEGNAKRSVVFVCAYNSVRSPMAEGILRHLYGDVYDVTSAGIAPSGLHPLARTVMAERGIDISRHRSRSVMELRDRTFDYVVTLCDDVKYRCTLPLHGIRVIHRPFVTPQECEADPSLVVGRFRALRDEIWVFVERTFWPLPRREEGDP
ncbi:MAG: arsenate reductase ArsC [Methanolinea sp.]|nr:arsenate reductase ArsC [Methanolinea sp.]